jgi:hypothetical protein
MTASSEESTNAWVRHPCSIGSERIHSYNAAHMQIVQRRHGWLIYGLLLVTVVLDSAIMHAHVYFSIYFRDTFSQSVRDLGELARSLGLNG